VSFVAVDEVRVDPQRARVYAEGWQSWSPTRWHVAGRRPDRPELARQHTMRFRPGAALPDDDATLQGEGLLVVDPGTGGPARWYGDLDARTDVVTLRAEHVRDRVVVSADGPVASGAEPAGVEAALAGFGEAFARAAGARVLPAPRVWCSWYRYFESVTAADVEENLAAFDTARLPVDVVQIDDGWSTGLGEWARPAPGFGDLQRLVDAVRGTGRRAGLWLAPFLVGAGTEVARRHPDWLVGDAGHNWGQHLVGLDLTHPGVRDLVAGTVRRLCRTGVDYLKLDFLYAGALPGRRHEDVSPVAAYRSGLELVREAAGPQTYLLGCGAPLLPSVGLVDAMRVSPDTFHEGGEDGSTGLRGRMSLAARAWQHGRFWANDPDCLVARPAYRLREEWAEAVTAFGGLRSCSDRIAELDEWGLRATRELLGATPPAGPFADDVVRRGAEGSAADGPCP
jgi:alpha-galactosidase